MSVVWLALFVMLAGGFLAMLVVLGVVMGRGREAVQGFAVAPPTGGGNGAPSSRDERRRTCPRPGCGEVPSVDAHYCPRCGVMMSSPEGKSQAAGECMGDGDGGGD